MVTREGSSSRVVWKTNSSSSAKHSVVAHATTSTDIEVGEEFEEAWKVAVVDNYKEYPMMGTNLACNTVQFIAFHDSLYFLVIPLLFLF